MTNRYQFTALFLIGSALSSRALFVPLYFPRPSRPSTFEFLTSDSLYLQYFSIDSFYTCPGSYAYLRVRTVPSTASRWLRVPTTLDVQYLTLSGIWN